MGWQYLGKLSPSPEWQDLDLSSVSASLLRITHGYNARPLGYALLSSVFSDGSRGLFQKLYPHKEESSLLIYRAGPEFQSAGFNLRTLSIKAASRTRLYDLSWTIEVEIWIE